MTISTDALVRSTEFDLVRAEGDDGLTLRGHGAVFNKWTTIDSWEGRFTERIMPGAFTKTLKESGSKVRLQFDHGEHPMIGSLPIGVIKELREDAKGLFVEARLSDNWLVQPVRDAIDNGSIDGMSFRFQVVAETWAKENTDMPERSISEVRLIELGPVVWPAYAGTDVGVRSSELARSLIEADDATRHEIATLLLRDTTTDEAVESDTSADVAVDSVEPATRHSVSNYSAVRPLYTEDRRRADLLRVRAAVEAATNRRR
jgi:HK97 family phage prohead protease